MKTKKLITYHGFTYEISIDQKPSTILTIKRIFQDSGIEREVKFDSLPTKVQEEILNQIEQ